MYLQFKRKIDGIKSGPLFKLVLRKESSSKTSEIDMSQEDRSTKSLETSGILCVN